VQPLLMLFNTTRSTCCVLLLFNTRNQEYKRLSQRKGGSSGLLFINIMFIKGPPNPTAYTCLGFE
jgi:hypothetical protein